ncbi:MAG: PKD domain-containing protein, partial [Lentisphaerae bacterium]|nr:PKD domain-containing protein [Lentisphaerota bacterium]
RTARPLDGDGDGAARPDMGCIEAPPAGAGALRCGFTVAPEEGLLNLEPAFAATVYGAATNGLWYGWDFDGDGTLDASGAALRSTTHAYAQPGFYTVTLVVSNDLGTKARATRVECVRVAPATTYVSTDGLSLAPYDTWGKAATNLQDAIDALLPLPGAPLEVVVSNGTHDIRALWAQILAPVAIRSLNGPAVTTLRAANPGQPNWRRVLFVNHPGAFISGFTMTGGNVLNKTDDNAGPGALRLLGGTVSNCVIRDNTGADNSGGVELGGGLLTHCTVANNRAYRSNNANVGKSGGVWVYGSGAMRDCIVTNNQANGVVGACGGGVRLTGGRIENCRIEHNVGGYASKTDRQGGGIYQTGGEALACTLADNTVYGLGGGAYLTGGALRNSLVAGNRSSTTTGHGHGLYLNGSAARLENVTVADNSYGTTGSGVYLANGRMTNSIAWFNGTSDLNQTGGSIGYSCWSGAAASNGNTGADPRFMDRARGDYRLSGASPCVNKG